MATIDSGKLQAIHLALLNHARSGSFPFYKELGAPLGIHARWRNWKLYLDEISRTAKTPADDVTWIVRTTRTKLPGQMDFKKVEKPTKAHWKRARAKVQPVIDKFCPGTKNPYDR